MDTLLLTFRRKREIKCYFVEAGAVLSRINPRNARLELVLLVKNNEKCPTQPQDGVRSLQ